MRRGMLVATMAALLPQTAVGERASLYGASPT